ncbi:MAG: glycerophosphodiester phosphodiesterase family protein [Pseudomonadota bacterium]
MVFKLPRVMGHRGAAAAAPENTLCSIRKAAELGARWVEFDVMLTGDAVPVLYHDDNLQRITGLDALMATTPYETVKTLDAASWFGPGVEPEPVPSLEAAVALLLELDLRPNVEIKPTPGRDVETAQAALETLAEHWPAEAPPPLISSFSRMALAAARVMQPDWPRALIAHKIPLDWRITLEALGCAAFHLNAKVLDWPFVAEVKSAGFQVAAFTVNRPGRARELVESDVDCIITDQPDRILAALAKASSGAAVQQASR